MAKKSNFEKQQEKLLKEEMEKNQREQAEKDRLEKERIEKEEQERLAQEQRDKEEYEALEKQQELANEQAKKEREEKERLEKERIEKEEQERLTQQNSGNANESKTDASRKRLSIWNTVKKATEEDKIKVAAPIENLADAARSTTDENNDEKMKRVGWQARANIVVELADTGFMVICLLLTWDFTKENQQAYTLLPDKKKAIAYNLTKIYEAENKKTTPKKEIFFLILGSYVPMLIVAVIAMINRLREKQEMKKQEKLLNQYEQEMNRKNAENEAIIKAQEERLRLLAQERIIEKKKGRIHAPKHESTHGTKRERKANESRGSKPGVKRGPYKKK